MAQKSCSIIVEISVCTVVMICIHEGISSLSPRRIGDNAIELEASGREEMFTWLQELQARRKDIIKQHRASARAQVIL